MTNWIEYTGSDEQIAEINSCENGYLIRYGDIVCDIEHGKVKKEWLVNSSHYWVIPDDPLREMKIRQSMTGQPVWIKLPPYMIGGLEEYWNETREYEINIDNYPPVIVTTTPDWNIPNAEYSFTEFE